MHTEGDVGYNKAASIYKKNVRDERTRINGIACIAFKDLGMRLQEGQKKMAHLYCEFKRVRQANDVFGVRRGVLWAFVNKKTIQRSQISENNPCLVLHQRQGLWFPCPFCVAFCFVHSLLQHAEESYLKGCSGSALTKTRYNRRPPNYKNSK